MNADARLGYSVMGYQGYQLAFKSCRNSHSVHMRLMGLASKDHTGTKTKLASRAKVGPFMTHVAAPPCFRAGPPGPP